MAMRRFRKRLCTLICAFVCVFILVNLNVIKTVIQEDLLSSGFMQSHSKLDYKSLRGTSAEQWPKERIDHPWPRHNSGNEWRPREETEHERRRDHYSGNKWPPRDPNEHKRQREKSGDEASREKFKLFDVKRETLIKPVEVQERSKNRVKSNSRDMKLNTNGVHGLLPDNTKPPKEKDQSFYNINTALSDQIDVQRILPDARNDVCKRKIYPKDLPKVSLVVIFRDEWPSVLIRTVYSALNNTPPHLLHEIVLVDDGSEDFKLRVQLKKHFSNVQRIKLVSNLQPLGLMMARQRGIETTTSDYFIVMDSHMEFSKGWLQPILTRLVIKPRNLLSANIGNIDEDTFKVRFKHHAIDSFFSFDPIKMGQLWANYKPEYKLKRDHSVSPIPIAAVQGMFIAMRKDVFFKLGGFDPGMKQWGSEQFELSFKVWMCGGMVEKIPCSHVAHVFRSTPWGKANKSEDFLSANVFRTSEVWMDDPYKSLIRDSVGRHSQYDIGDLTDRHRIRKENNCKPFQYFIDMVKKFSDVYLLDDIKAKGEIRNKHTNKCLSIERLEDKSFRLEMHSCRNSSGQYFIFTERNHIRALKGTIVRSKSKPKPDKQFIIDAEVCPDNRYIKEAEWQYRNDSSLYHEATKKCLTVEDKANTLFTVRTCDGGSRQHWIWNRVNSVNNVKTRA